MAQTKAGRMIHKSKAIQDINIPIPHDPRIYKVQIKRDFRLFDLKILGHEGNKSLKIYQLKAASPIIYIFRKEIKQALEDWMRAEGCYTDEEIKRWSQPIYEWPEERISPEQEQTVWEWRKKYKIKDRTDWTKGVVLTYEERLKLDEYKQVSILQPRQSGKSEVVVRINIYLITIIHKFRSSVFAPTETQAKEFIFRRTRDYIESHPMYATRFKTLNALDMELVGPEQGGSGSNFGAASASPTSNIEGRTLELAILDESQDITEYKVRKSIKYMLAATNGAMIKIGTVNTVKGHFWESTTKKGTPFWHQVIIYPDIVAATRPDWGDFIRKAIQEEGRYSDTVRMSVFLEWLLDVGMFITEEQWQALCDTTLDWVEYDKEGLQFCLIDVAKSRDETIAMVIKVDPTVEIEGRHPFRILNCMALQGVDYVSQFHQIKSWIDTNYNVAAVGVDATGGRGGISDQFRRRSSYRVEDFIYTRPSKSEWYTNLSTIVNAQYTAAKTSQLWDYLIRVPASEGAKKEKIYRDFEQQMMDLQKEYKGQYLVVHHPDIEGAKDDYGDVLMMAAWMASRVHVSIEDIEDALEDVQDTTAGKIDWEKDQASVPSRRGSKKRKEEQDDDLLQIVSGADDLSGPDW